MLLEVIGKPPEHLVTTLEKLIESLNNEKGVSIQKKEIKEPMPVKDKAGNPVKNNFYTTFAEVEIDLDEINSLAYIMFRYMPAHVEILSPEHIAFTNNDLNELFNELSRRLHGYDEVARVLQTEKNILEKKLRELMEEGKESGKEKQ